MPLRIGVESTRGCGVPCIGIGSSLGGNSVIGILVSERGVVRDIGPASSGSGFALISHGSLSGSGRFSYTRPILHRFIDDVLHRPNGSLNLAVALGLSRTARDMFPPLRELSEHAARELWTIV